MQANLVTFILLGLICFPLNGQSTWPLGMPAIQYYSTEDYQAGMQNYAITQDQRGILYIANNLNLIEYDGSDWRPLRTLNGTKVRSVYTEHEGRVFVGAQNEFGYFSPNSQGKMTYKSLKHLIPESYKNFEDVWDIFPTKEGLLFVTTKQLMWYDNNQIQVIVLASNFEKAFYVDDQLIASFRNEGLKLLQNGSWSELPYQSFFQDKLCTGLIAFTLEYHLVSTQNHGLFLVNDHEVLPFAIKLSKTFARDNINTIYRTRNGTIAVGTNDSGLYLLDKDGNLIKHINKEAGLNNRTVFDVFEDSFGNLWVGLNNGLARIKWQPPFTSINENMGLPGAGYTALSTDGRLYLGTNNDLFSCTIDGQQLGEIVQEKTIYGQIYNIQRINEDIFVCGHEGAWVKKGDDWERISSKIGWWKLLKTKNPNKLIAGNYDGLYLFEKKDNQWKITQKYPSFNESSRVMEFDRRGRLWVTHAYKGVFAFDLSDDYQKVTHSKFYNSKDGFPSDVLINVFPVDGRLVFPAETGIYIYDRESDSFTMHRELTNLLGDHQQTRFLIEDNFGNIYFITRNSTGMLRKNQRNEYEKVIDIFNRIHAYHNDDLDNISIIGYNSVLYGAKNGFIHYDNTVNLSGRQDLLLLIRHVSLPGTDSTLFSGAFMKDGEIVTHQPQKTFPEISYDHNAIKFGYSAINFLKEDILYRTKLKGFENKWSEWSVKNEREFTNLREGNYTFQVQAKDVVNRQSDIQTFTFIIKPPWYRTKWAYLFYLLFLIGSVSLIAILYNAKYKREKLMLIEKQEAALKQKDQQLVEVSKQSSEEINRLKNEKLRSEVRHKTRELANSTMHVLEKNNLISSIKDRIIDITRESYSSDVRKELKRIIKEIDHSLEEDEDWDQFEILFDEVHVGFLQKIQQDYPDITPQEVKLSAYLKMGMSSKEIANLMKISVRGVEIGRYRLRKKLGLKTGENLTNFMINYGQSTFTNKT